MESREEKLLAAAVHSTDYRSFLKRAVEANSRNGRANYSALARKAGFSSRGFVSEIIDGRRRLTGNSYPKMVRALALPPAMRTFFSLLVARDEKDLNYESLSSEAIEAKLSELRAKFSSRLKAQESVELASSLLFKSHHVLACYAVLGNGSEGVSVREIAARTGLDVGLCETVVRHLVAQNVAVESIVAGENRFHSVNSLFSFEGLGESHSFKASYLETLGELRRKASTRFNAHDQLFCQSYFSVDRKKLPELKRRMRDLIEEFVEANGHDDGDCVARLLVGLYS